MNAVEIEEAVSALAGRPFEGEEFPFAFLQAFGNKRTTIKRLRSGASNGSDIGGVLQRTNIHIKVCPPGEVTATLAALGTSAATARAKAKFTLATDGLEFQAEDLTSGEVVACHYPDLAEHFGFFLPLAGITTVKQIRESAFDIKATGRLNRLYIELLKDNPDWGTAERRHEMNHFMARIIFCFFAEDTDIFNGQGLFTDTVERMSSRDSSNTDRIIAEVFRAMNTKSDARKAADVPRWADAFPYVNGGLFSDSTDVPQFSRIARSYLVHIGNLDWQRINPDIFGSMIQAVADDKERGALGMHYTSVPNILKVLNPLFLDDLRGKLEEVGGNSRKLLNLRERIARIRIFDPACGSGNFLVVAYKELRQIESEINSRRNESGRRSDIPLTNFRGIEVRDFPAEIARLALIIAEYQCDVLYRGQREALKDFLPLDAMNWITCGNALRLDWLKLCPPTGVGVKNTADDLFQTPLDQPEIDFEYEGGETYICSNPPYRGSQLQTAAQKADLKLIFEERTKHWKSLDYVSGWFLKSADYGERTNAVAALVSTNSVCQGRQVSTLWPLILSKGQEISFAHTSFKWANLAAKNAGVTVVVVGMSTHAGKVRRLFSDSGGGRTVAREVRNINPYLVPADNLVVKPARLAFSTVAEMRFGNMPNDGGHLLLTAEEAREAANSGVESRFIRRFLGSQELIKGFERRCIWVGQEEYQVAREDKWLRMRFGEVEKERRKSRRTTTKDLASVPFRFGEVRQSGEEASIVVPRHSSESREYLPVGLAAVSTIVGDSNCALYGAPIWNLALLASRLHLVWIATVCGKLKTDFRYSSTAGWNTFPIPPLTEKNRSDLNRCAENILLAREAHFPATIADLYDPERMPDNLRAAHERNDEVLERIYIGRRFRNDTERLEKLFDMYSEAVPARRALFRKRAGAR
ncbi:MAG: class I SAM-dependent DNA methyltransferase [Gammaproteobacteria bacterium]|nr:class I SAM-dependent DNA methyltransferase [Gammaproteobacteria bacterium]